MIIGFGFGFGFGFGSPLVSILMLLATSLLSYTIYKAFRRSSGNVLAQTTERERRREFYYQQRARAREMIKEYDLTDEDIERRIDEELKNG